MDELVLDVGTGDGTYAIEAAVRGAEVTALDASPEMLQAARARAERGSVPIKFCEGDVQHLPFETERFDVMLAVTVLCSVKDVIAAFGELARVLAPGGTLVVGELGRWSTWAAKRRLQSLRKEAFWPSVHFWTPRDLHRRVTDAGLRVDAMRGAIYFPPIGAVAGLWLGWIPPWHDSVHSALPSSAWRRESQEFHESPSHLPRLQREHAG